MTATTSTVRQPDSLETVESIAHLLARATVRWPDRMALTSVPDGVVLTYAELAEVVERVAVALASSGVETGDRVAVMMANRAEYAFVWLACARLGAVMVPVNANYRRMDAGYLLHHANCSVVVCDRPSRQVVEAARTAADSLQRVLDVDAGDLADAVGTAPSVPVLAETTLNIQYTSGTSGRPKGCVLSHRYWLTLAYKNVLEAPRIVEDDVLLTAQPFSYMDPQWNLATSLACGARLVVLDRFHPSTFWRSVVEHRATFFYCLGVMPRLMLKMEPHAEERDHHLRVVTCSGIPPALHRQLEERFGVPWLETYGMTEIGNAAAMRLEDHDGHVGSGAIGRATASRELRVVDDHDRPLPRGEVGELVVRGTGLMDGYYRDPDATERAFRNGWFHTGDLARIDERGFLYFAGRTKDVIRRSGENIAAAEVEEAIVAHPEVQLAACVAVPDELRGEEAKAYVVLRGDAFGDRDLLERGLPQHTAELLAAFKVPRYWEYRAQLPLTPSAKVRKADLAREPGGDGRTWDRAEGRWQ
jgi:crotonobetaine/carnitine-CoA ligase